MNGDAPVKVKAWPFTPYPSAVKRSAPRLSGSPTVTVRCVDTPFGYEIFNLGESRTTSLAELIALVEKHAGKAAVINRKPLQPGDVEITYADIQHARDLLGYDPHFSMDEGIARFVAWYKQQG